MKLLVSYDLFDRYPSGFFFKEFLTNETPKSFSGASLNSVSSMINRIIAHLLRQPVALEFSNVRLRKSRVRK